MPTILYPTRGGAASYPNQDQAIALAAQTQSHLVFMYVYNIQFLGGVASPIIVDINEEMEQLGEFLLAMAQERAEKQGIQADALVKSGIFRQAVKEAIREQNAQIVVLGAAVSEQSYTNQPYLDELINDLQAETGVEVYIVQQGEIIRHAPAINA